MEIKTATLFHSFFGKPLKLPGMGREMLVSFSENFNRVGSFCVPACLTSGAVQASLRPVAVGHLIVTCKRPMRKLRENRIYPLKVVSIV